MRASSFHRSPLLLLAAALVAVAVLFAPGAQPAQAQTTTVWSATLTVATLSGSSFLGCQNTVAGSECSTANILTDDDFTYGGVEYQITRVARVGAGSLVLWFSKTIPDSLKAALTMNVGTTQLALADAIRSTTIVSNDILYWNNTGLSWSVGDTVSLSLTEPSTTPTVSISASPTTVDEGSRVTITLTLSEALSSSVTIPLVIDDDTAESSDHGTLTSITIPAGATSGTGTITTRHDADFRDEIFIVWLDELPPEVTYGTSLSVTITILDDDFPVPTLERLPVDNSIQPRSPSQRIPEGGSASDAYCYVGAGNGTTEYIRYPDGRIVETANVGAATRSLFACD